MDIGGAGAGEQPPPRDVDACGVERGQRAQERAARGLAGPQRTDREGRLARQRDLLGDRRQRNRVRARFQEHLATFVEELADHRRQIACFAVQRPPRDGEHGVLDRERSLDLGGRRVTGAGADDGVRLDAPVPPQCGEADLERHQRRVAVAVGLVEERPSGRRPQRGVAPEHRVTKRRLGRQQRAQVPEPRTPAAGEHEGDAGASPGSAPRSGFGDCAGVRLELAGQLVVRRADDRQAIVEMAAPDRRRAREGGDRWGVAAAQDPRVLARQRRQRDAAPRRDREDLDSLRGPLGRRRNCLVARRLADDHVRVHAGQAERGHAADERLALVGPRRGRCLDHDALERDPRVGRDEMQARRQQAMLDRQRDLDEPGDPRRGFGVPDVGLDRADPQRAVRVAAVLQHRGRGRDLDRVADDRSGAVGLEVLDVVGGHAGVEAGRADHRGLAGARGRHQIAAPPAVVVDRRTQDQRVDRITVAPRGAPRLERDHAHAVAPDDPVGARVAELDPPVRRQQVRPSEAEARLRREDQVDATRQRERTLPAAQALARCAHRDERRRTIGVEYEARPLETEHVRDPSRHAAARAAHHRQQIDLGRVARGQPEILVAVDSQKHARRRAAEIQRPLAAVVECLPRRLEREALLRIHPGGLAR